MTGGTLGEIEAAIDRATRLPDDEALETLQDARAALREIRSDQSVEPDRCDELDDRIEQHVRVVTRRDEYDSGIGAAMNPDEEDAP